MVEWWSGGEPTGCLFIYLFFKKASTMNPLFHSEITLRISFCQNSRIMMVMASRAGGDGPQFGVVCVLSAHSDQFYHAGSPFAFSPNNCPH